MPINTPTNEERTSRSISRADSHKTLKKAPLRNRIETQEQHINDWNHSNDSLTNQKLLSQVLQAIEYQPEKFGLLGV